MPSKITNRTVSQVKQFSNWSQDVLSGMLALEDFNFFTFADLDFFDRNETIQASFKNFRTDDIVQTGSLVRLPVRASGEPGAYSTNEDVVRLYYGKVSHTAAASEGIELVSSALLAVELEYNGILTTNIIATEDETGTTLAYGIARLGYVSTPASEDRYKTVETSPGVFEQVFLRTEDYWYAEDDEFVFEDAFQHDIYGNVVRSEILVSYEDSAGDSFTRYPPVYETETWDVAHRYYYMELDTVTEAEVINNEIETGLNWGSGLHGNPSDAFIPADDTAGGQAGWTAAEAMDYTWTVTSPAWTKDDIVINEARFWGKDNYNRFS